MQRANETFNPYTNASPATWPPAGLSKKNKLVPTLLALVVLGAIEFLIIAPAQAVSTTTPFNIVSPVSGYQGKGFYFTENGNNNGSSLLRVTNVTLTLDYRQLC